MRRVESETDFGGGEDFRAYDGPTGAPYHEQPHHVARSLAHQPNHRGFLKSLKRFFHTNPAGDESMWARRRLMRRIRRP